MHFFNKNDFYMKKWFLVLASTILCLHMVSKPPLLKWESGWCWNNVIVHLLYNARDLTECLLNKTGECAGKDDVLKEYINLVSAIRSNPNSDKIFTEMQKYHGIFCKKYTIEMSAWEDLSQIQKVLEQDFFCCRDLFELENEDKNKWSIVFDYGLLKGNLDDRFVNAPRYVFVLSNEYVEKELNVFPALSNELKKNYSEKCLYELIGIGHLLGDNHYVAYIKDQWDPNPKWYLCNDMAPSIKEIQANELPLAPKKSASVLVYKRISVPHEDRGLEKLAQALKILAA